MSTDRWNGQLYGYPSLGRFGLGHSLLAWARCFLWCRENQAVMLAPRWLQFRLGPYLRREMDKRSYHKLFRKDAYPHGMRRLWLLASGTRFLAEQESQAKLARGRRIVVFKNDSHNNTRFFRDIFGRHDDLRAELLRIARPEQLSIANAHEPFLGIHVRMGDFTAVTDPSVFSTTSNVQLPVSWYREILLSIRRQAGCYFRARVFSDGPAEALRPLLELPNVTLVNPCSALHDIFALSQAVALISSGSGFSMWAAYLGQVPRICFPISGVNMLWSQERSILSRNVKPARRSRQHLSFMLPALTTAARKQHTLDEVAAFFDSGPVAAARRGRQKRLDYCWWNGDGASDRRLSVSGPDQAL